MSEQTLEQLQAELETLRKTNAELVAKNSTRKGKVTELEATVADLQAKLTASNDTIRQITIDGPLRKMAEEISPTPELWLEQFSKLYRVEMIDKKLTILTASEGKPVHDKDGKVLPFEWSFLAKFLTEGDDANAKSFRAITIASRASGGQMTEKHSTAVPPTVAFGLR